MPWLSEAKKDVTSCDKPRRGANTRYQTRISEWGNPSGAIPTLSLRRDGANPGN